MGEARVRRVEARDVGKVAELVRTVLAEFGLTFGEGSATDAQVLGLPASYEGRGGAFWVAEEGEELLGTCGAFPVGPRSLELRKMYLSKASRGRGVGKALFAEAVAFAKTAGAKELVLDTVHGMTEAIRFYEGLGFVRDDSQIRGARCTRGYRLDLRGA